VQALASPTGPLSGAAFADAFHVTGTGSTGGSSDSPQRMFSQNDVAVIVQAEPTALNQLAEFHIRSGVPGYSLVVSYIFRAVPAWE
jgi:hypothetical protein